MRLFGYYKEGINRIISSDKPDDTKRVDYPVPGKYRGQFEDTAFVTFEPVKGRKGPFARKIQQSALIGYGFV